MLIAVLDLVWTFVNEILNVVWLGLHRDWSKTGLVNKSCVKPGNECRLSQV